MAAENSTESEFWGSGEFKKLCKKCGKAKPIGDFPWAWSKRLSRRKRYPYCKACAAERMKDYRKKHPDHCRTRAKRSFLKRIYGLTELAYNEMLSKQNGLCAICGKPEEARHQSGVTRSLCVDHNHSTGQIRALLCTACNQGIGCFYENPELLRKAISYLESHALTLP